VGSAVQLLLTLAFRSSVGALAQRTTVDRDDIAGLGAAHDDRRQGVPVASPREWCRDRADIVDIVETGVVAAVRRAAILGSGVSKKTRSSWFVLRLWAGWRLEPKFGTQAVEIRVGPG